MSAQRQKPIDFAAEGLCLALSVNRNCGIRDYGIACLPSDIRPKAIVNLLKKGFHGLIPASYMAALIAAKCSVSCGIAALRTS
jgi:hypothetical protein